MKTVGTKLDNTEYEIFEFCCSEKGLSKSEQLRKLIKQHIEQPTSQDLEIKVEDVESIPQAKVKRISYDDGESWIDIPELENITVD
jgi:hypothetical protein